MSTFGAVFVLGPVGPAFYARAPALGLITRKSTLPSLNLWITTATTGSLAEETIAAATKVSSIASGSVLALFGHTNVDTYAIAEARAGEVVRSLLYVRDDDEWKATGEPQPWEADFHFVLPLSELTVWLQAYGWSPTALATVGRAYAAHDTSMLQRLPPPTMHQVVQYVQKLGFDWDAGPDAHWSPPGFFGRLFGG